MSRVATKNGTADSPTVKPVVLLQVDQRTISVRIEGTSPLIVHAWSAKAIKMMEDAQQKKAKKGREPKDPEAEFRAAAYIDKQGRHCFIARALKKSMVAAATSIDDKVNFPKTKIRQAIFINGDLIPLVFNGEPEMRTDPVSVGKGGKDIRYRPEYWPWAMDLEITYNASVLTAEQIVNLLNLAGFAVGIGEWRPEKDGSNGRFKVANA